MDETNMNSSNKFVEWCKKAGNAIKNWFINFGKGFVNFWVKLGNNIAFRAKRFHRQFVLN